ncbi:MAG: hypothetical protein SOR93_07455 [Clostridiales Family XIII bacterium]|nr:hypothetical protein [Clostridia bacterium]MDE8733851.1 hypothetical protein [Eubacteriales bacterium DFI.9.88]MDY3011075.1 hypothetical protein [Clostridiales Family XIII bacterium]
MEKQKNRRNIKKTDILRTLIFLAILLLVIAYLCNVFTFPKEAERDYVRERFNSFYAEEKDTLDGVYIGSSGVERYWIPAQAWNKYGMAVYGLSSGSQPTVFIKYLMEEALKSQDPELFIIDMRKFSEGAEAVQDLDIRRVTDNMRFSVNRIQATKAVLDYVKAGGNIEIDEEDLSYYIPIMKYHSRWDGDLDADDFVHINPGTDYKGYFGYSGKNAWRAISQPKTSVNTQYTPMAKENEAVLNDLLDYCDTIEQEVLFVLSPYSMNTEEQAVLNSAIRQVEERGYPAINFNTEQMYDTLDFDFDSDLYNTTHTNFAGAMKYTNYLSNYIHDHYKIEDHRGDNMYQSWDESYEILKERVQKKNPDYYKVFF